MDNIENNNVENNIEKIVNTFSDEYKQTLEGLASGEPINEDEFFTN